MEDERRYTGSGEKAPEPEEPGGSAASALPPKTDMAAGIVCRPRPHIGLHMPRAELRRFPSAAQTVMPPRSHNMPWFSFSHVI